MTDKLNRVNDMVYLTREELVEVLNLMFNESPTDYKALNSMYDKLKNTLPIEERMCRSRMLGEDQ